jgi:uncharacterized protein (TIGR03790 family)
MISIAFCRQKAVLTLLLFLLFFQVPACIALEPSEILVLANRNAARSINLAEYYMKNRQIPKANLLKLWVTDKEWCSREEYEKQVIPKVRKYIREKDPDRKIKCILLMYGVPLKINPPEMSPDENRRVEELREEKRRLDETIKRLGGNEQERQKRLRQESDSVQRQIHRVMKTDQRSSLDSEIALVLKENYDLSGWIPNPFFLGFKDRELLINKSEVLLVSRLDGSSDTIVKRIMDDSIAAENTGLGGSAYFDARWAMPDPKPGNQLKIDSGFYDRSIHAAAELVRKSGRMAVVVNDKPGLFSAGECPDAGLYCGWYSLAKYVDAFTWRPGAVGFHIASSECQTLKSPNSQVWCKRMLEEGAVATIGPTSEPYLQAFTVPEMFFGLLLEGQFTLAECYALSTPFLSWQMVLIGDPLYRPFKIHGMTGQKP